MAEETSFEELGLAPELLTAVAELGFEKPTAVQEAVIPRLLAGTGDFVGLAQTGTGKTAAFGLPIIQQTDVTDKNTQVLILCPTRELCLQIARDLVALAKYKKNVRVLAVFGGSPIQTQIAALRKGVHIVVATPGRILDLLRRREAKLVNVRRVVLDEADEMLNMGFQEDLEAILKEIPDSAQTLLFSATMPKQVSAIAGNYMHDPEEITIGRRNAGAANVTHVCYTVHAKDRYPALKRIADFYPDMYGIVFCRTRAETQDIADKLIRDGYNADSLHGDLTQAQRDRVMRKFRGRTLQMLVATDVAARGLDVTDLTHIVNYKLPDDLESYTHRSGRTGRAGKTGMSIVIVHMREKSKIQRIQQLIGKKFEFRKIPSGRQVCESQLIALIGRVKDVAVDHDQIDGYLPEIQKLLTGMSREDLIKHFVSLEFNRFLDYYRAAPDLNVRAEVPVARDERTKRGTVQHDTEGLTRLSINLGREDQLSPSRLMELVNSVTPGRKVQIGRIEIRDAHSFFEVDSNATERVVNALGHLSFVDKDLHLEIAEASGNRTSDRTKQRRWHKSKTSTGKQGPRAQARKRKTGKPKPGGKKRKPHRKGSPPSTNVRSDGGKRSAPARGGKS